MNKEYWGKVVEKLVDNLLSMKWWMIVLVFIGSAKLLAMVLLTGGAFTTLNTTLLGIVMGMREIFKVAKVKSDEDTKDLKA